MQRLYDGAARITMAGWALLAVSVVVLLWAVRALKPDEAVEWVAIMGAAVVPFALSLLVVAAGIAPRLVALARGLPPSGETE